MPPHPSAQLLRSTMLASSSSCNTQTYANPSVRIPFALPGLSLNGTSPGKRAPHHGSPICVYFTVIRSSTQLAG